LSAACAKAAIDAQIDWPNLPGITVQITDGYGHINPAFGLNDLVKYIYNIFTMIGGLAAFAMVVKGGILWLTSTGNPTKINEAKGQITSALIGLIFLLGSYIILKVLNPDILTLNPVIF
jgi:hypothetical protein